jgi:hypothetical protein
VRPDHFGRLVADVGREVAAAQARTADVPWWDDVETPRHAG